MHASFIRDGYSSWMSVFRLRLRVRNRFDGYRYECFDRFEQLPSINMCLILNEMSFFSFNTQLKFVSD